MRKIVMLLSVTLFSWLGWMLGEEIGMMTAYMLSFVGSLVGVVAGVWFNKSYLG